MQVYPFGQQWIPSEQQNAFGKGQHPNWPDDNLQQVFPSGHCDCPPGQTTLFNVIALVFKEALITSFPLEQEPEIKEGSSQQYLIQNLALFKNIL